MIDAGDQIILSILSDEDGKDSSNPASKGDETCSRDEAVAWEVSSLTLTIAGLQVVDDFSPLLCTLAYVQEGQLYGVEFVITETERSLFVDLHQRVADPTYF